MVSALWGAPVELSGLPLAAPAPVVLLPLPLGAVVEAADLSFASPVTLSLQCVAAEILGLLVDGEFVDWAAAPTIEAQKNAEASKIDFIGTLLRGLLPSTA